MSDLLPITLVAALILLTLGVLATLFQIHRTARRFEAFLATAQHDLHQACADVHALRLHLEQALAPFQAGGRDLAQFAHVLADLGQGIRRFQGRILDRAQRGLERASSYLSGLRQGLAGMLRLF